MPTSYVIVTSRIICSAALGFTIALVVAANVAGATLASCISTPQIEVRASQSSKDAATNKVNEISGLALAGFTDREGRALLWGAEQDKRRVSLLRTWQSERLNVGEVQITGPRLRDVEDIAVAGARIYISDTGTNQKYQQACVRFERHAADQCHMTEGFFQESKGRSSSDANRADCLGRGDNWLWVDDIADHKSNELPVILRFDEPKSATAALRRGLSNPAAVTYRYPETCAGRACGEFAVRGLEGHRGRYNAEALAVIPEPNGSHTAYVFTKAHKDLASLHHQQRPTQPTCVFDDNGISDVFKLENVDTLSPDAVHVATYVTSLDLSPAGGLQKGGKIRITAADYRVLSSTSGLLLVKTKSRGYRWPITGSSVDKDTGKFDLATVLRDVAACAITVPGKGEQERGTQEAAAQVADGGVFHIGECKGRDVCNLFYIRDQFQFVRGDIDGNGRIDGADVAPLRAYLAMPQTQLLCAGAADLNGDNIIAQDDLDELSAYLSATSRTLTTRIGERATSPLLGCTYYSGGVPAGGGV